MEDHVPRTFISVALRKESMYDLKNFILSANLYSMGVKSKLLKGVNIFSQVTISGFLIFLQSLYYRS